MFKFFKRAKDAGVRFIPTPQKKAAGKFTYYVEYSKGKNGEKAHHEFKYKKWAVMFADLLKLSNAGTDAIVRRSDQLEEGYINEDVEVYRNDKASDKKTRQL